MPRPLLISSQSDNLIRDFDKKFMTNSADPDQLASSGSTVFCKTGHVVFSKRRVNLLQNNMLNVLIRIASTRRS